jgi:hypothetical protein
MTAFEVRVWDPDYQRQVFLDNNEPDRLRLTVSTEADAIAIELDDAGVKKLRLALSRYERSRP